jgi:hypothetical protein
MTARKDSLTAEKGQQVSCNSVGIFQQRKDSKVSLYLQVLQSGRSRLGKLFKSKISWWMIVSGYTFYLQ